MYKAIVETATGRVLNRIVVAEDSTWTPPEGCEVVDAEGGGQIGDVWDGNVFQPRTSSPEEFSPDIRQAARLRALRAIGDASATRWGAILQDIVLALGWV